MTEQRDESRDLLVDAYGCVSMVSQAVPFDTMIRSVSGKTSKAVAVQYSPTVDLESVTREWNAALKWVAELKTEVTALHDRIDALEHPSCSRCGCLLIPDRGPWKCDGGCVADPDVCDD